MSDVPLHVVSIVNYPRELPYLRMAYAFLDSVIAHGAERVTLLYHERPPVVTPEHAKRSSIEVIQGRRFEEIGHPHFNLWFKLPNLASLNQPFLYLDSDMFVLSDLQRVWQLRDDKPYVAVNHQWIPSDPRTHRSPFLNSGFQLVGDPSFYDLDGILAAQNAVAPLSKFREVRKADMFCGPGHDQAVLKRYFDTISYDYTHPEIGFGWNSCAGVTEVKQVGGRWQAHTRGLANDHDAHIIHYWDQFKPWAIDCPIYRSYAGVDEILAGFVN